MYQFTIGNPTLWADRRRVSTAASGGGPWRTSRRCYCGRCWRGTHACKQFMEDRYQTAQGVLLSADVDMVYRALDVGIVAFADSGSFQDWRWGDADRMEEEEGLLVKMGQEVRCCHIKPKLRVCRGLRVKRFGLVGDKHDVSFVVASVEDSDAVWCGCLNGAPAVITGAMVGVGEKCHLAAAQCSEFDATALTADVKAIGAVGVGVACYADIARKVTLVAAVVVLVDVVVILCVIGFATFGASCLDVRCLSMRVVHVPRGRVASVGASGIVGQ